MKTSRMWFAALCFLVPWSILMLITIAESDVSVTRPVVGRVTYNGRPLEEGIIYFDPIDGESDDRVVGIIGKDGVFTIDAGWRRGASGQSRFRIALMPDPTRRSSPSAPRGQGPRATDFPLPARFVDVRTSGLLATLGREDARVDVDLKD